MMAPARVRHRAGGVAGARARHQHDVGRGLPRRRAARGHGGHRAGDGPVRRRDRHGPGRGAPPQPAARPTSSRSPPRAARPTTPASTRRRSTRCSTRSGYADLRAEQAARRERGDAVQIGIGVSVFVEITGGGGVQGETPRSRCTPTARSPCSPAPRRTARGTRTAWAMLASEHLGHPDREDHRQARRHRPRSRAASGTMGSRSLQTGGVAVYQAAGELVELAKQRAADAAGGERRRPRGRRGRRRSSSRGTDTAVVAGRPRRARDAARRHASSTRGRRRSRSARTSPSRRRRRVGQGGASTGSSPSTTRARSSTRCSPRASGTAASRRASRRRCWRRSSTTRTATRSPPRSPTTASRRRPSCPASRCSTWPRPTHLNPLGVKGIGEAGTIGATPAAQSAVIDALAHLGVRHIDMPLTPLRVWEAIRRTERDR